jgi:hypothetical protein
MNKKGSLNFVSMFTFAMILVLFTAGTGYLVGYATNAYGVTPDFNEAGVDIVNDSQGLEYFVNGTQLFNQTLSNNSIANDSSLIEGGEFITTSIAGTSSILGDIVSLTPLGAYKTIIQSAIAVIFVAISAILLLQFIFNRSLN